MSCKVKADHILAYLIIVLLLYNMMTEMSSIGINPSISYTGKIDWSISESSTVHKSFDYLDNSEVFNSVYPLRYSRLENELQKSTNINLAFGSCADTACIPNSFFVFSEEILLKLDPGIISAFLHDKDGMK